jgi:hypothetical protein
VGRRLLLASGAAALLGAVFHGSFPAGVATAGGLAVWLGVGTAVALTAIALYELAWMLVAGAPPPLGYRLALHALALADLVVLWRIDDAYWVIVAFYAPALGLFTAGAAYRALVARASGAPFLLASGLVSVAAAVLQQSEVALPAAGVDHNALYHIVQLPGLVLLYRGLRRWEELTPIRSPP